MNFYELLMFITMIVTLGPLIVLIFLGMFVYVKLGVKEDDIGKIRKK